MKIAVCPGSFDPVTLGHVDIIRRSSKLFDEVIVVVMSNYNKREKYTFTPEERMSMLKQSVGELPNVVIDHWSGLLADYTRMKNAVAIVKGLRAVSDFDYEFQQALTNKRLNPDVETVFITTSAENMFLSSSVVKQVATFGGDISTFVPPVLCNFIEERLKRKDG